MDLRRLPLVPFKKERRPSVAFSFSSGRMRSDGLPAILSPVESNQYECWREGTCWAHWAGAAGPSASHQARDLSQTRVTFCATCIFWGNHQHARGGRTGRKPPKK